MKPTCALALLVGALSGLPTRNDACARAGEAPVETVEMAYPGLASGVLTFARLVELPKGVLLRAGEVKLTAADIKKAITDYPEPLREQLERNAFFVLEHEATQPLITLYVRKKLDQQGKKGDGKTETEIVREHFEAVTAKVEVADDEVARFYEDNKPLLDGAELRYVKAQIRRYLVEEKQEQAVREHLRDLGRHIRIEVAATWTNEQSTVAADNPLDKARRSGKPSLVAFSGKSCCGPDRMLPLLDSIREKYADRLNVVYLEARAEQVLAMRCHVASIPTEILYDKDGKEVSRHTGPQTAEALESKLAAIGVK